MKTISMLWVGLLLASVGWAQVAKAPSSSASATETTVVPRLVRFSGAIKDIAGKPKTGVAGVTFAFYKDQEGGGALWLETQNVNLDSSGRYTVMLGASKAEGLPAELFASGEARWLGVQAEGQAEQARVLLLSVPYALKAADAETIGGLPPSAFMRVQSAEGRSGQADAQVPNPAKSPTVHGSGTPNFLPLWSATSLIGNSVMSQSGSNVGIGTTSPATALDVNGAATVRGNASVAGNLTTTGTITGLTGSFTANGSGSTLATVQNGSGIAVLAGFNTGVGVDSFSFASSGNTVGVQGLVSSPTGTGVLGQGGTGLHGTSLFSNGTGVLGQSPTSALSGTGNGFKGSLSAGIWGDTTSPSSIVGVLATADASTALFAANNGFNPTLQVLNNATNTAARIMALNSPKTQLTFDVGGNLEMFTDNLGGVGAVIGNAGCGTRFYGLQLGSLIGMNNCTDYTLLGDPAGDTFINSSTGSDGVGNGWIFLRHNNNNLVTIDPHGNMNVAGNLSKGGGSFKIDHPLDPANKYLYHSFVESPDMMNIYNGLVTLDARGSAWIIMPDYFEALNRDFRYQLTSIGGPQPNLYVRKEMSGNRFKISGGEPGGRVSWQVTGVRQDAWANANRIPVEVEKPAAERGHYLHPELYETAAEQPKP
jgi:hypothetical protein